MSDAVDIYGQPVASDEDARRSFSSEGLDAPEVSTPAPSETRTATPAKPKPDRL